VTEQDAPVVRDAGPADVAAVCRFGEQHVGPHYAPLLGVAAAQEQVRRWWSPAYVAAAVDRGQVVLAEAGGVLVGVGQHGLAGSDHVVYKLYVHPGHRGGGVGVRLLDALVRRLPAGADRVWVEHVAANERAGAFYEREGFTVDRVEPGPAGDPRQAQVWRSRPVPPDAQRPG